MISKRIQAILSSLESEDQEFFETLDKKAVAQTACAFLNASGGRIVIGADANGNLVGLSNRNPEKQLRDVLTKSILPASMWTITVERSEQGRIVVIDIPNGVNKPYIIDGTIWYRNQSNTRIATPDDVTEIIKNRIKTDERWERRPALGITSKDLDLKEVRRAAEEIQKAGRHQFNDPKDAISVLNELSLFSGEQFSNAAVVLFGKHPTRVFPQSSVRITVYKNSKRDSEFLLDKQFDDHLFSTFDRIVEIVESRVDVISEFDLGSWQRTDKPTYPFWSLREGILNALIHRDLSNASGGMSVGIYPDKIQVWNSGTLPKGWKKDDLTKDHPSVPPNPDIAHVCFLRGLIEKLGRGTQLIAEEFTEAGLETPVWKSGAKGVELIFKSVLSSRRMAFDLLNQRQRELAAVFKPNQEFTVDEYVSASKKKITERTARSDLNVLIDSGLVEKFGKGRSTYYIRTKLRI